MPREKKDNITNLSDTEELFCQKYIETLNQLKAYQFSHPGASYESSKTLGARMFTKVHVVQRINDLLDERAEKVRVSADNVLSSIMEIRDRCMQAVEATDREGKPTGDFIFDSKGALRANELIGRHLGMWNDKLNVKASVGGIEEYLKKVRTKKSE